MNIWFSSWVIKKDELLTFPQSDLKTISTLNKGGPRVPTLPPKGYLKEAEPVWKRNPISSSWEAKRAVGGLLSYLSFSLGKGPSRKPDPAWLVYFFTSSCSALFFLFWGKTFPLNFMLRNRITDKQLTILSLSASEMWILNSDQTFNHF